MDRWMDEWIDGWTVYCPPNLLERMLKPAI